jgi:hypothetical protein
MPNVRYRVDHVDNGLRARPKPSQRETAENRNIEDLQNIAFQGVSLSVVAPLVATQVHHNSLEEHLPSTSL